MSERGRLWCGFEIISPDRDYTCFHLLKILYFRYAKVDCKWGQWLIFLSCYSAHDAFRHCFHFSSQLIMHIVLLSSQKIRDILIPAYFKSIGINLKVIRHVFGFGIEFLENKDIGIFGHFIVIDFIKRYSYHTYFSPISTSWFRRFGTGCIVRNGEWRIFCELFRILSTFEEGILGTPVQKDAVPPIFISK